LRGIFHSSANPMLVLNHCGKVYKAMQWCHHAHFWKRNTLYKDQETPFLMNCSSTVWLINKLWTIFNVFKSFLFCFTILFLKTFGFLFLWTVKFFCPLFVNFSKQNEKKFAFKRFLRSRAKTMSMFIEFLYSVFDLR